MKLAIWGKLWRLSLDKRSSSSLTFSLRYYKDIVKLFFWVLWSCLTTQTQSDTINLPKTFAHLQAKKTTSPLLPSPFLEILQRYANLCWVLWSWLVAHTQNDITSLQKTSMFICMPKINFSIHFFLEIYILKNPAIWLADSILAHNSRTRILPDMGLVVKYQQ